MISAKRSQTLRLVRPSASSQEQGAAREEELVSSLERGAPVAAGRLYDHVIGNIDATLFKVLGRRIPEHDDLVQNTFEQIVITLRKKRFAGACSLRSWASAIATNVALNFLRSLRTDGKYFDREVDPENGSTRSSDNPEHDAQVQRDVAVMRELLAELPAVQAQTLLLHDAFGYELSEISVLTKASVAAAQSRLVRGRKKLRQRLIECGVKVRERT